MTEPLTESQVQAAFIGYLKTQNSFMQLLVSGTPGFSMLGTLVRESQFQGADFVYPAIRVYVDMYPTIRGCGPDTAHVCVEVYSEQKSSLEAKTISGALTKLLHKVPFSFSGIRFIPWVSRVDKTERSIYAWMSKVYVEALVF